MTTVTAGNTASFEVGPFDTVTLNDANAVGTLRLTSQTPKLVGDQTLALQSGTFGPWGAPMAAVLSVTQGSADYTVNVKSLTATGAAAAQALVSEAGSVTSSAIRSTTGTPGQIVKLSDGDDKGMLLQWLIPAGSTTYAWCWFLSPNDAY